MDIFNFLHKPHKNIFIPKKLCADIEYADVHKNYVSNFLGILKLFFIIGLYAHERKKTTSR
jgi:hypothetical protein